MIYWQIICPALWYTWGQETRSSILHTTESSVTTAVPTV